jgi:CBS domain containing-hemolysin-like protein
MDDPLSFVVFSLVCSAFFSATEIAFLSANRLHIAVGEERGHATSTLLAGFIKNPSFFIASILIGNTVALVVFGIYMVDLVEPGINQILAELIPFSTQSLRSVLTLFLQTIFSTIVVLLTAEFIPKSLSLINPDRFIRVAIYPMLGFYYFTYFPVWLVVNTSNLMIKKIFRLQPDSEKTAFGLTDLTNYVFAGNIPEMEDGSIKEKPQVDTEILNNAIEFKNIKARECMVPRKEIVAIELEETVEALSALFVESGHSKIPVYKESVDNIIGYCHHFSLFKKPSNIKEILTDLIIVPETMLVNDIMIKFIGKQKSLALVVDEFGGTSGILTIEDIIEEIFGDIEDEFDAIQLPFKKVDDRTYELSARHEIDVLTEQHNLTLPEGDYETLGGFILSITKDIPQTGEVIEHLDYKIIIKSMAGARIDMVTLELLD